MFFDDALVHIAGHGARTPTVSTTLDLLLKLHVLLLQLESRILEFPVPRPQLLHPQARQGPRISLNIIVGVIHRSRPYFMDAFDMSLGCRP